MDLTDLTKLRLKIRGERPHEPPPLLKALRDLCSTRGIGNYHRWYQVAYSCPILLYTPTSVAGLTSYKLII